ncbi:MAG: nicotinate phosphoribosyltransferase [Candidatus Competibacteraceae bacterium]|nr:nicotinate phosphoribosyltransferase [Candidatus Competibacteraceae bacterium]
MNQPTREDPGFDPHHSALFTDLYELTMAQAYQAEGMSAAGVFELFFRKMPEGRNFVMAAGLSSVLDYLESLHFTGGDIGYLRSLGQFSDSFLEWLRTFRFTGSVWAVPEGTVVFENEPVVQVVAPIAQAQLVETFILNQIHLQSVAATKAARVVTAAQGRAVVDFGSRRSHGTDAALKVARACYLAGAAGTSNVAAGRRYGIPVFGTMAHSYIQAHDREAQAFAAFVEQFPETTLLVDTFDTLAGVERVIELARQLGSDFRVRQIRLDSGNLGELAREARRRLDQAGLDRLRIIASSSLDEYKISQLLADGAPIDGFGVGTRLAVSKDVPEIDFSYKLVAYDGQPKMKLSSSKLNRPGRKQVFRRLEEGQMCGDTLACHGETLPGQPLLEPVMAQGKITRQGRIPLEETRQRARAQLQALPEAWRNLEPASSGYPLAVSTELERITQELTRALEAQETAG